MQVFFVKKKNPNFKYVECSVYIYSVQQSPVQVSKMNNTNTGSRTTFCDETKDRI